MAIGGPAMRLKTLMAALLVSVSLVGSVAAAALEPMILGWEQRFKLSWDVWDRRDQRYVSGYVTSSSGETFVRMQLLVEALDASGQVTGQQVDGLPGSVPPFGRAYFEVRARTRAPEYRVRVFAYDVIQAARAQAP